MRVLVTCLIAVPVLLSLAAGADGQAKYPERLTFSDVGFDGRKRLLSRHNFFALSESLSPDRRHLAYVPWFCDGCARTEVRIADVRSGDDRLLLQAEHVGDVAWSPSGRTIAVSMQRTAGEAGGIWLVAPDGSNLRRRPLDGASNIAWSPDSRSLACDFGDAGGRSHVGVAFAESEATRVLAEGFEPKWSPNGRLVLFQHATGLPGSRHGSESCPRLAAASEPWRVAISPSGLQTVVELPSCASTTIPTSTRSGLIRSTVASLDRVARRTSQMAPIWSPDGRTVAFTRTQLHSRMCRAHSRCEGLFVVPAAGGAARFLTRESGGIQPLAWSRNGRTILYAAIIYPDG